MGLKGIAIAIIILLLIGSMVYYAIKPSYPIVVNRYKHRYQQMNEQESKTELIDYAKDTLNDPIEALGYWELLMWEHRHIRYADPQKSLLENYWLDYETYRAELPIPILEQIPPYERRTVKTDIRAVGRCGEFALLYIGLLLARDYTCRLVIDCSYLTKDSNKTSAGDHVWVEVFFPNTDSGMWIHIDPTEGVFNRPTMYAVDWNKNVNRVYAITENEIIDVTDRYRG